VVPMPTEKAEAHEKSDVETNLEALQGCRKSVQSTLSHRVQARFATAEELKDPSKLAVGSKLCHFIRHGEGEHNVAQREWRSDPKWDGTSEPYTLDTDLDLRYLDAKLTEKGLGEARALQNATAALKTQLLVVSPMRRATSTGLLAFESHIKRGEFPVLAHEFCHERAGKHTCDKRLTKAELAKAYPMVDYSHVTAEEDPYWSDGLTREPWQMVALRSARFVEWLLYKRPEKEIAVAAHSAFLLSTFNGMLDCADEAVAHWFGTGEMRSVVLTPDPR